MSGAGFLEVERARRVDLAAAYRLVALFGWDDLVFTHISSRLPDGSILVNPFGMTFDEITASSLIRIDLAGNKLSESPYEVNRAGLSIHTAIHSARPDAGCVIHTHSVDGTAVSIHTRGLLPISQKSLSVLLSLSYHDYDGITLDASQEARLVASLGKKRFLILRNHGLLTVGQSVAEAFLALHTIETACTLQVRALAMTNEPCLVSSDVLERIPMQVRELLGSQGPQMIWASLLRRLERTCPDFRG